MVLTDRMEGSLSTYIYRETTSVVMASQQPLQNTLKLLYTGIKDCRLFLYVKDSFLNLFALFPSLAI